MYLRIENPSPVPGPTAKLVWLVFLSPDLIDTRSDIDLNIVDSGDHLAIGENDIEFLHTPGHTPGSQCFKVNNNLVSGDTLFVQGCGRVDLPGSNSEDMFHSLRKLSSLPDENSSFLNLKAIFVKYVQHIINNNKDNGTPNFIHSNIFNFIP